MKKDHPIQPLQCDDNGTMRFKQNGIIAKLFADGALDLNQVAREGHSKEDQMQLAQLLGYSLSGYASLSYVTDDDYAAAALMSRGASEEKARVAALSDELNAIRTGLLEPIARLFGVHPDDLERNLTDEQEPQG